MEPSTRSVWSFADCIVPAQPLSSRRRCFGASASSCEYRIVYFRTEHGNIDIDALHEQCTPDVRLVFLNSPHNPTGDVCSNEAMEQLVAVCADSRTALVVDAVYNGFSFTDQMSALPLSMTGDWSRLFVVNSMSKNYGAPGLRIGWLVSTPENVAALGGAMERELIAVCGPSQEVATRLLEKGNRDLVATVRTGRETLSRLLPEVSDLTFSDPQGGVQFFVKTSVRDIEAFGDHVMVAHGLVVTTGSSYEGLRGSYLRLPMGNPTVTLERAVTVLRAALAEWKERSIAPPPPPKM
jgi:beta-methylarginine biosynthesis bifunctional aminotransferase